MLRLAVEYDGEQLARALRRAPGRVHDHADRALGRGALEIARDARRRAPKAHSILTQAISVERPRPLRRLIVAGTNYAAPVEDGSDPHRPPLQPLVDWVRVRRIRPRDPGMTERDLAYVISRSIGRRGTPAQPYLVPALEAGESALRQRLRAAVDRGVREALA